MSEKNQRHRGEGREDTRQLNTTGDEARPASPALASGILCAGTGGDGGGGGGASGVGGQRQGTVSKRLPSPT